MDTDSVADAVAIESVVVTVGASSEAVLSADCEVTAVICVGLWVSEPSDVELWVDVDADSVVITIDCVGVDVIILSVVNDVRVGESSDAVL